MQQCADASVRFNISLQSSEIPLEDQKRLQEETKDGSLLLILPTENQPATEWKITNWMDHVRGSEESVQVHGHNHKFSRELLLEWNRQSCALKIPCPL